MSTYKASRSSESDGDHTPVLLADVVSWLITRAGGVFVDATLGLGGHTRGLVEAGAGQVIALDRDRSTLEAARTAQAGAIDRVETVHADYRRILAVLAERGVKAVDGIVADLGMSSRQLDDPERGFSFRRVGPLDMRLDQSTGATLAEALATVDEVTLADVIWRFGEERQSRRIARAIVRARDRNELTDTGSLASAVRRGAGGRGWQRIDPATRTFQALRIWINDEIDGLDRFVTDAASVLAPGGRLAIIAFHSLEDRAVKHTYRRLAAEDDRFTVLTRRPVVPSDDECARNPRARSARLRVLERVA